MRLLLTSTALLGLMAAPAAAQTFTNQAIEIRNAAALLTVTPEDRADIVVTSTADGRLAAPTARVEGGRIVIDGGLRNRIRSCSDQQVNVRDVGNVRREDLPRITIRAPRTLDLGVGGAVFANVGASAGGEVALNGCGSITMADASGDLELALNGSGDINAARIDGDLEASLNGSGSLTTREVAGGAEASLNGSGDLTIGNVGGPLEAALHGSGSLSAGNTGGATELSLMGSGDFEAGAVRGSLEASLRGSGSMEVASVEGQSAELQLSSSGDISVRGGRVDQLQVQNLSSGNVHFGGTAAHTSVQLSGSGDIEIANAGAVDRLIDNGSGDVSLGR